MAPLNPNNTERYKVFYTTVGHQHTMTVRTDVVSPSSFGTVMDGFFTAIDPLMNLITIDKLEYAAGGSNVFNPVASTFVGNTYGSGAGSALDAGDYIDFIGRSTGGRRVRLAVFGTGQLGGDYRFIQGESTPIDDAVLILNTGSTMFLSIDNVKPTWYGYANTGHNAYWQRAVRP